jgi:succinate dehydrogenase/fumarate reductase cytochrome b subunit
MSLWFEIAVLVLLAFLVHSVDGIRHDLMNTGVQIEKALRDLAVVIRERDRNENTTTD